jgi:anti-sigma-K factor RskA
MIPTDPEELDLLAGEYVLGTLEAWQAREVEAALAGTPALRAAVGRWERRLAGLAEAVPPETPPAELWSRIAERVHLAELPRLMPTPRRHRGGLLGSLALWRFATAGLAAAAAVLAFMLIQPPPTERYLAVLQTDRAAPAWVVEGEGGNIVLTSLNPRQPDPGRSLELWALPPGATAPTSLGVIPAEGRVTIPAGRVTPQPGMLIEVSLEPEGGSPTGLPTGPVLFIGRLEAVPQPAAR